MSNKELKDWPNKKYYDANALTSELCMKEISMRDTIFRAVTSSLAIGEALMNILNKSAYKDLEQVAIKNFIYLLAESSKHGRLYLISSEKVKEELNWVSGALERLDFADGYHLAIAIHYRCNVFVTNDSDFNLPKETIGQLKEKFNLSEFSIEHCK